MTLIRWYNRLRHMLGVRGICRCCGARASLDPSPVDGCPQCPPRVCDRCGQLDSPAVSCLCWVSVDALPTADLKALMAGLGADVEVRHD